MPSDSQGLLAVGGVLLLLAVALAIYLFHRFDPDIKKERKKAEADRECANSREAQIRRRRRELRARAGRRGGEESEDDSDEPLVDPAIAAAAATSKSERRKYEKEARKLEKRETKQQAAAERGQREQQRQILTEKQQQYRKKIEEKEKAREDHEKEQQRVEEEKRKEEEAEYNKWKAMISVDSQGHSAADVQDTGEAVQKFVSYIKMRKVVNLQELAGDFGLRTQAAISRIESLEQLGRLNGVFDDRGKYIYLSEREMNDVASYLKTKGRVSKSTDLVDACNRFIRLSPTDDDRDRIREEERLALLALNREDEVDNDQPDPN